MHTKYEYCRLNRSKQPRRKVKGYRQTDSGMKIQCTKKTNLPDHMTTNHNTHQCRVSNLNHMDYNTSKLSSNLEYWNIDNPSQVLIMKQSAPIFISELKQHCLMACLSLDYLNLFRQSITIPHIQTLIISFCCYGSTAAKGPVIFRIKLKNCYSF